MFQATRRKQCPVLRTNISGLKTKTSTLTLKRTSRVGICPYRRWKATIGTPSSYQRVGGRTSGMFWMTMSNRWAWIFLTRKTVGFIHKCTQIHRISHINTSYLSMTSSDYNRKIICNLGPWWGLTSYCWHRCRRFKSNQYFWIFKL